MADEKKSKPKIRYQTYTAEGIRYRRRVTDDEHRTPLTDWIKVAVKTPEEKETLKKQRLDKAQKRAQELAEGKAKPEPEHLKAYRVRLKAYREKHPTVSYQDAVLAVSHGKDLWGSKSKDAEPEAEEPQVEAEESD